MSITAITPTSTTNRVYGWLKTDLAIRLVQGGATFATVMAAFNKENGKAMVKEQKYLNEAVQSNAKANIIVGLENIESIDGDVLSSADATITGAATATQQLNITGNNSTAITYESLNDAIATVSATGLVTYVASGTTTIRAKSAETDDYFAQEVEIAVTVS